MFGKEKKKANEKSFVKLFRSKVKKSSITKKENCETLSMISSFPLLRSNNSEIIKTEFYPANTLYTNLSRKQIEKMNEFKNIVNKDRGSSKNIFPESINKINERKKFYQTNLKTSYLTKKGSGDKPFIYPIMDIHDKSFKTISEKNRFEKNYQILSNLKCRIQDDEENSKNYVKEFFYKNGLFEEVFMTDNSLEKFIQFLKKDLNINPEKTLKQTIIEVLKIHPDNLNQVGSFILNNEEISGSIGRVQSISSIKTQFPKTVKNFFPFSHNAQINSKKNLSEKSSLDLKANEFFEVKKELNDKKLFDTANIKNLCFNLEKEICNISVNPYEINKVPIKNFIIRDNKEIVGPLSTLNQESISSKQYQQFKKKNKLLELIFWKKSKNQILINEEKKKMNIFTLNN